LDNFSESVSPKLGRLAVRVAFHVHSDWSYDGHWSIPELVSFFRSRGFQGIMLTEHDRGFTEARRQKHRDLCAAESSEDFMVVPGIEYSDESNRIHMLTFGRIQFLGENRPTLDLLRNVKAEGGVAVFAHPRRKEAWADFSPEWESLLAGIEVWNRKTDGWAPGEKAVELVQRTGLPGFCGMDFHGQKQYFPLAMIFKGQKGGLREESIVAAMRAGEFSAEAFGHSVDVCMQGSVGAVLDLSEKARRSAAWVYRAVKSSVGEVL
jgi:predicted metal-dependent phosphoesterase TrpH